MNTRTKKRLRQAYAVFKISVISQLRTPAAIVFGFVFPILLLFSFGFSEASSTQLPQLGVITNPSLAYQRLSNQIQEGNFVDIQYGDAEQIENMLSNGSIDAYITFSTQREVFLVLSGNNPKDELIIQQKIQLIIDNQALVRNNIEQEYAVIVSTSAETPASYLDFALPGLLGFSLLSGSISAVAFSFLALKETKAIKRLFATPLEPSSFIIGQSAARLLLNFAQIIVLIVTAQLAFGFELENGLLTLAEMGVILILGIFMFLGLGYIVAGIAKNNEQAGPLTQLFIIPQILLAGSFFGVSQFPIWLQFISKSLPLYNFNTAMRLITIQNQRLWSQEVGIQIGFMLLWVLAIYGIASRVFTAKDNS